MTRSLDVHKAWGIRLFQMVFAIVNVGLISDVIDRYESSSQASFTMFVSAFTLLYLIITFALSYTKSDIIVVGHFFIFEILLSTLWFIAMIVWGVEFGNDDCNHYIYEKYLDDSFPISTRSCQAAKAVIAFNIILFLLFSGSSFFIFTQVIKPLNNYSKGLIWKRNKVNGYLLNKTVTDLLIRPHHEDLESNEEIKEVSINEPEQTANAAETEEQAAPETTDQNK